MIRDVVIVGAGPVGLFLACQLRLAGVRVLVLERDANAVSPLKRLPFGMRGLSAPTLEALDRCGLLDAIDAVQTPKSNRGPAAAYWLDQPRKAGGHFAGIQFFEDAVEASKWRYRLPSPLGTHRPVEMAALESVLATRALAIGAEIHRNCTVNAIETFDDRVLVRAGEETLEARWLVGCDGGRSVVRKAGGFDFVGTDPEFTGYSLAVDIADPNELRAGRHYTATGMYTLTRPGTVAMAEFDGGAFHRLDPVTLEHAQSVLRRISGVDVTLTALHLATTWTDRAYQATTYRNGRILLAGDAAHIHSPLGGQGLNLGIGDATNLGWKLAATIRGAAAEGLLDSYTRERHPIGAAVLDWSRAQVAIMRPSRSSRALAAIVRDLIDTRDGATYFAERVWGVSVRCDLGDEHPLVGRGVPDFELADGTRVGEHLRRGRPLLLDFDAHVSQRDFAAHWNGRIEHLTLDAKVRLGLTALLVRPDGVVAWATSDVPDVDQLARSAERWLRRG